MIKIERPKIVNTGSHSILQAHITIESKRDLVWFKVSKEYGEYLCYERGDAFLIAVLNYAMRNKYDVVSEAPISEDLYYNLETYLIDALCAYNPSFYRVKISAQVESSKIISENAVGTGISCGVDSLHAVCCQTGTKFQNHNITHLMFNNVGSHGEGDVARELYLKRIDSPLKFAKEYNYKFVATDSNIMDVIKQDHFKTHTYSSIFAVYCMQKLFSVYFYASAGYKYHEFTLIDKKQICPGSYEMFSLPIFSTNSIRIYSEGENISRMEKIKTLVNYAPSYKYLNVCLRADDNCGICEKCIRTLLAIDAAGAIEKYYLVFNIEYYKSNKKWYLQMLVYSYLRKKHDYIELYPYFKKEINLIIKIIAFLKFLKSSIKESMLFKKFKKTQIGLLLKKLIKPKKI